MELITTIIIITLFITSLSAFIRTQKLRKVAYPLIIIYLFVVLPIISKFIDNRGLSNSFAVLSAVIIVVFVYWDLIITDKEKNLLH
ncbi:MAG: hypothetical protein ACREV6_01645 [Clostridium sp.]|uniref:hypothetical protein n=1 Tax=Clostridium sp. TaxID=1506 RepID=UPI003D6CD1ED